MTDIFRPLQKNIYLHNNSTRKENIPTKHTGGGYCELSKNEFEVLVALLKNHTTENLQFSQREIAKQTGISLGTVNATMSSLHKKNLIERSILTNKGLKAIEPYRAKRAVIFASTIRTRLFPIILNTPTALIRINGKRIIDRYLDMLLALGIKDITVVTGYRSEQFHALSNKYSNIKFITNKNYNSMGSISNAMCVTHLLSDTYVIDDNVLLQNNFSLPKYNFTSTWCAIKKESSDNICFDVKKKSITAVSFGGANKYEAIGISYWSKHDGQILSSATEQLFLEHGGKELSWEYVPFCHLLNDLNIQIQECFGDDCVEINSYADLEKIDSTYVCT